MKKAISLILLCLTLTGCSLRSPAGGAPAEPSQAASAQPEVCHYAPGHPLEQAAPGALWVYPLHSQVQGIAAMGDSLLLFSGDSGETRLSLLTGEALTLGASVQLAFSLDPGDPSLRIDSDSLSYYDPTRQETVVRGRNLEEICQIAAPEGLVGKPLLSSDRTTLYYCTASAIRAWDLETGIRRCLREQSYTAQALTGLHQSDTVLQCRVTRDGSTESLFLDADTGRVLGEVPGDVILRTHNAGYYASVPEGAARLILTGQDPENPMVLTPSDIYAESTYLENQNRVLVFTRYGAAGIDCYDLATGVCCASLKLDDAMVPVSAVPWGLDAVYLLLRDGEGNDLLCRWDLLAQATRVEDGPSCLGPRPTKKNPDTAALEACQKKADRLGKKYGIQVLVWNDPLSVMPWDYEFQPEYLAPVLQRELAELDLRLSYYPPEILEGIKAHFPRLTICLVRQITGSAESGSVAQASGVQFFEDTHAYIAIALGQHAERALYHELYHVMETRLLTDSTALDRWDTLNPTGFAYEYDYASTAGSRWQDYLQPDNRYFIDTYSMSFPKEDRARIMECAMQSGNDELFRCPSMVAKLACLSHAIREAYGLKDSPGAFRWEQYLQ